MTDRQDNDLDTLFAAARQDHRAPSPVLLARVLRDADRVQAGFAGPIPLRTGVRGWIAAIATALGGGPAVAGVATAALAGFWIGIAQPDMLGAVGGPLWAEGAIDSVELIPDLDEVLGDAEG